MEKRLAGGWKGLATIQAFRRLLGPMLKEPSASDGPSLLGPTAALVLNHPPPKLLPSETPSAEDRKIETSSRGPLQERSEALSSRNIP